MSTKFYRFLILLSLSPFLSGKEGRCDNTSASLEDATEAPKKEKWFKKKKKQIEELVAENPTTTNVVAGSTLGGLGTGGILGVGAGVAATAGTGILAYKGVTAFKRTLHKNIDAYFTNVDHHMRGFVVKREKLSKERQDNSASQSPSHSSTHAYELTKEIPVLEHIEKNGALLHMRKRARDLKTYVLAVTHLDPKDQRTFIKPMEITFAKNRKLSAEEIEKGKNNFEQTLKNSLEGDSDTDYKKHLNQFDQMIDYHLFSHELPAERKKRIQDLKPTNPEEREKRKTYKAIDRHMRLLGK